LDKAIITALMIIAGVVVTVSLFNVVYPAVARSGDAMVSMERRIDERMKSQIEIIHATGNDGDSDVSVWVKNVGSLRIAAIDRCDVFFGLEGDFARIPYGQCIDCPYWDYELENGTEWDPSATLKIRIRYGGTYPSSGRSFLRVVAPNGISDQFYFTVEDVP